MEAVSICVYLLITNMLLIARHSDSKQCSAAFVYSFYLWCLFMNGMLLLYDKSYKSMSFMISRYKVTSLQVSCASRRCNLDAAFFYTMVRCAWHADLAISPFQGHLPWPSTGCSSNLESEEAISLECSALIGSCNSWLQCGAVYFVWTPLSRSVLSS